MALGVSVLHPAGRYVPAHTRQGTGGVWKRILFHVSAKHSGQTTAGGMNGWALYRNVSNK